MRKVLLLSAFAAAAVCIGIAADKAQRLAAPRLTLEQMCDNNVKQARNQTVITRAPQRQADADARWETLLHEDFSWFTDGTTDAPDMDTMYPTLYFENASQMLESECFHDQDGWWGVGIYSAGGAIALGYEGMGGMINTPAASIPGRIRVTIRAKVLGDTPFMLAPNLARGDIGNPQGVEKESRYETLEPGGDWQDLVYITDNPYTTPVWLQINGMMYNKSKLVIDDVKIERDMDFMVSPSAVKAEKFTSDGFTATWDPGYAAKQYEVSLLREHEVTGENKTVSCDMADVAVDTQWRGKNFDPYAKEYADWKGNVSGMPVQIQANVDSADEHVRIDPETGKRSLLFRTGDQLVILSGGYRIIDMTIRMRMVDGSSQNAQLSWYMKNEGVNNWTSMYYKALADGTPADFVAKNNEWYKGQYTDFYITFDTGYNIDNAVEVTEISFTTTPELEILPEQVATTSDLSYAFTGLDMEQEYRLSLRSIDAAGTYGQPVTGNAYGVAPPQMLPATDITENAYTANWSKAAHATSYDINTYDVFTLPEDNDKYIVMDENFSGSKAQSDGSLLFLGNMETAGLDDYTDNAGWEGSGTLLGDGCLGCYTDTQYGGMITYELSSPMLDLSHNGGVYDITLEYSVQNADDYLVVQGGDVNYVTLKGNGTTDFTTATLTMEKGYNGEYLLFYAYNNSPFLLRKVTVTQALKEGEKVFSFRNAVQDVTDTWYRCESVTPGVEHAYQVASIYDRYGTVYHSDFSEPYLVGIDLDGIEDVPAATGAQGKAIYYDLTGRRVMQPQHGLYIRVSDGKAAKVCL